MGQGHSHSKDKHRNKGGRQVSSNYAPKSQKRSNTLPTTSSSTPLAPSPGTKTKKQKGSTKEKSRSSQLPLPTPPFPTNNSSRSERTTSYSRQPVDNSNTTHTSSHSGPSRANYDGERAVLPSRQFSLTRQTPTSSTTPGGGGGSGPNKHAQIEKYFNKYKDPVEDAILAEGMEKFCIDLCLDPTEFTVLVLAWKFEASQMCRFTREEFVNGCQKIRAYDSKSLKERFPELLEEVKDTTNFKELYNFTFSFGLDHSTGQRSLPTDMAIPLWDLVFSQNRPDILDRWFNFLESNSVRGVSRDNWNMFLPFVETIKLDFSNYDESEAWPSLFDDFVETELENQQQQ